MKTRAKIEHGHEHANDVLHFVCHAPAAQSVFVAGTFNDWQPDATPMTRADDGEWETSLPLSLGRYEYKFVVDGQWCCEPGCTVLSVECPHCIMNDFGTMNRVLEAQKTSAHQKEMSCQC